MRRHPEAGFTLLEIGLALSIGVIVAAGIVVLYNQIRDNSGDAEMRNRLASLQTVVESLYNQKSQYPTLADVRIQWKAKRPDDYQTSPWGGITMIPTSPNQNWNGIGGSDTQASNSQVVYRQESNNFLSGAMYYYRIVNESSGPTYTPNAVATASLWDQSVYDTTANKQGKYVSVTGYGLGGQKGFSVHFMVVSGR